MDRSPDKPARARMRVRLGAALALAGVLAVAAVVALTANGPRGPRRPPRAARPAPPPTRVSVWVHARHPGARVPRRFLGLSFEVSSAAQLSRYADRGDLVTLLRSLGSGVLRLGGASADTRVAWSDARTPRPAWASRVIGPRDLRRLARLARRSGWRVLLTVGLVHYDPRAAAREAASARAAFGSSLIAIEVGNEPDSYGKHGLRSHWSYAAYSAEVSRYRRAIAAAVPGIPLAGPGVSGSSVFTRWGPAEAHAQRPALLTGHHYPLGCHAPGGATIERLLSRLTRAREDQSLERYLSVSRASAIPFRMDEANSVSCGGKDGVSNTFAAALWAVSYIARTMAAGAAGINLQGAPATCAGYSPVCAASPASLAQGALHAQPEWYALLLARALAGTRPVRATVAASPGANVSVTALLGPAGALKLVIVDDQPPGAGDAALTLHVGAGYSAARVLALSAPSPQSRAGVLLGGGAVARDGSWRAPASLSEIPVHDRTIALTSAPSSAMLLTVAPDRAHTPRSSTHS